jgi:hypothetical protein
LMTFKLSRAILPLSCSTLSMTSTFKGNDDTKRAELTENMDDFQGQCCHTNIAERFMNMHDFMYWWLEDGWVVWDYGWPPTVKAMWQRRMAELFEFMDDFQGQCCHTKIAERFINYMTSCLDDSKTADYWIGVYQEADFSPNHWADVKVLLRGPYCTLPRVRAEETEISTLASLRGSACRISILQYYPTGALP